MHFKKAECLAIALIKVDVWVVNYQKGQDIYIYKWIFFF